MNILVLSELFHPHGSGAELATFLYADLLSRTGCNVKVITNRFGDEPSSSKIGSLEIYRLPLLGEAIDTKYSVLRRSDVLITDSIRKMMRWSNIVYVPRFWFSAILAAKAFGKPVVVHVHDFIPVCPLATLHKKSEATGKCDCSSLHCSANCIYQFEKLRGRKVGETVASLALNFTVGRVLPKLVGLSDAVICVSRSQREIIGEKEPSLRRKLHVLYNPFLMGTDVGMDGKDFGYFGGRDSLKGFVLLCKALVHRRTSGSEQIHVHATKLLNSEPKFEAMLENLGFIPYSRLDPTQFKAVYRQIQTVLVPSIWGEPWPYVVVEALTQRRLLVASRIGGIPEQVEGCAGAFLFEPGDERQLLETIEMTKSFSKDQVNDFGMRNKEVFLRRFNNESSIRKFIRICEHLT
jgi:glycosyltransferase involved in cell wall biosynthesis